MRKGAEWKKVRQRKHGGGDCYIEERFLSRAREEYGEELEYTAYQVGGCSALVIRFRAAKGHDKKV